uniref:Uncharacterized protein n=2 Tax=Bursaphelenchus xylophilus TaxID=6326 RepID=A0A1I7SGR7_BURXY
MFRPQKVAQRQEKKEKKELKNMAFNISTILEKTQEEKATEKDNCD